MQRKDGIFFMPRKKKEETNNKKGLTASGRYRVQVAYYDDDGVRRVKSFTADTYEDAEFGASLWKRDHNNESRKPKITAAKAVRKYIDMKRSVLSPSSIRNYARILKNHIEPYPVGKILVEELTSTDAQIWISTLSGRSSPKTVKNVWTLLKSSVEMFVPDARFRVTLPQKQKKEYHCPNDNDIQLLLEVIRDKYGEKSDLEIALYLAAFGTLRRGEICALTSDDILGNSIHVSKTMVQDEYDCWEVKAPKTYESDRIVELPGFVMDLLKEKTGKIVGISPDLITSRFRSCVESAGIEYVRFHDLRHYSASIMHAIGVPDQYIMDRGGWSSDNVMKTVYRNVIDIEKERQVRKINDYFAENFNRATK